MMSPELCKHIGKTCQERRRILGWTKQRIGIRTAQYSRIERGKAAPSLHTLVGLGRELGLTPNAMLAPTITAQPLDREPPSDSRELRATLRAVRACPPHAYQALRRIINAINVGPTRYEHSERRGGRG